MTETENYLNPISILIKKGKISAVPGVFSISNQGVHLEEKSKYMMMFGLIGLLFKKYFKSKFYNYSTDQIASIQKSSFGLNKEVLDLKLKDGSEHTLIVKPNLEAIVSALKKLNIEVI